jgi:DNA-binding GntR family transcriptional regulator
LLVDMRRRIESFALSHSFSQIDATAVGELEANLAGFHAACARGDLAEAVVYDMAFHRWIVERTGQADLVALWLSVVVRMRLRYTRHHDLMEAYREHETVVEGLRRRDMRAAVRALEANIQ